MTRRKQVKSRAGKIWAIVANTVLIIFVLIGILIAVSLLPIKNNYRILAVMSGSMEPTILVGALIVVKPVSEYKIGDIITFQSGARKNDYTTHRIYDVGEQGSAKVYVTKGDANEDPESEKINQDKIIGKEFYTIALIGYVLGYIKTLPGLILIVVVPAVIIVYEEVNKIKHEAKIMLEQRRKKREAKKNEGSKEIIKDIKPAKKITKAKKKEGEK